MTMSLITIILPLLLLVCTKQTSAQAPAYGLGGYTMDGQNQQVTVPDDARLLKTADDVNSYKKNDHANKQFNPCRISSQNIEGIIIFQVFYDEETAIEGCTVDFVFKKIDEIRAKIAVADAGLACLDDCLSGNEWTASSANLSNEEIKTLHNGPPYNEDQKSCKDKKPKCEENGGKCMASPTSLQFAMNKCAIDIEDGEETTVRAWIHLVGEPLSSWNIGQDAEAESNTAAFGLTIETGDKPTITIEKNQDDGTSINKPHGTDEEPVATLNCFTDDKLHVPIPVPQFWKIKSDNSGLNGKHLLVFHLLPQSATRVFNENGQLQKAPASGMPKCKGKLSIGIFNALGILQSVPRPPTTTQTTEKTTSVGTTSTATSNITTGTKSETTGASGNVWFIVAAGAGAILLLAIVVFVVVWCLCCRNKKKPDDEDKLNEADEEAQNHAREGVSMQESVYCDSIPKSVYCDSVPKSVYCEGVSVPDSVQSDYVE